MPVHKATDGICALLSPEVYGLLVRRAPLTPTHIVRG